MTPLLVAAISTLTWNCNWTEILDTHLDYLLNPWKWQHWSAAGFGEHYSYSRLMHQLVKTERHRRALMSWVHAYTNRRSAGPCIRYYREPSTSTNYSGTVEYPGSCTVVSLSSRSSRCEGRLFLTNRASISA